MNASALRIDAAVPPVKQSLSSTARLVLMLPALVLLSAPALWAQTSAAPPAAAQEGSSTVAPPAEAPPAEASPASHSPTDGSKITLKDGQTVCLRTTRRLSSGKEKEGNEVAFEVTSPVKVGDLTVIPTEAPAFGKIAKVQHSRRREKPGTLEISLERVRLVDGQWARLRGIQPQAGQPENKVAEIIAGVSMLTIVYSPVGFAALLLAHGQEATVPQGYDIAASINGDVPMDRAAVVKAQKQPEVTRSGYGTVVVYWARHKSPGIEHVTCGDVEIGALRPGHSMSLRLPPGRYWFRTVWDKAAKEVSSLPPEYSIADIESGTTTYLRTITAEVGTKFRRPQLSRADNTALESEVPALKSSRERIVDKSWIAENLSKLQAQPDAQGQPKSGQSAPSTQRNHD